MNYFKPENWVLTPNFNASVHSCRGTCLDEISQLQMRQFTKEKFEEGVSDIKSILGLSGVKTTFADYGAKMLGDVDRFQRVIQRKRKIGSIGEVGQYPEEFKKIKTFNHETYTLFDETFYHEKSFQYFFLPEFIPLLNGVISGDGTFSPVKHTDGVYQFYIISAQLYNSISSEVEF
jgi:hypothetical protein